jgi:hypothetical protein
MTAKRMLYLVWLAAMGATLLTVAVTFAGLYR